MTVYVIALVKFTREEYYRRYQSRFAEVFKAFRGRLLAADERPKVLDGEWTRDKVVIVEFPDEAEATRFLDSPSYQERSPRTASPVRR
ncbi:DUF1330 domain-containing protein [Bradyrhizobium erythrophlei]|uniref:DUF1330 domain-containing protein n=1 Tax=Bradyrhizobium erythrophlei TaxID=1437360 RepID=UPI0035E66E0E